MVSAQQTNLLPKNASRNDASFAQQGYWIYVTTSEYLSSYGCAITMVYTYILFLKLIIMLCRQRLYEYSYTITHNTLWAIFEGLYTFLCVCHRFFRDKTTL